MLGRLLVSARLVLIRGLAGGEVGQRPRAGQVGRRAEARRRAGVGLELRGRPGVDLLLLLLDDKLVLNWFRWGRLGHQRMALELRVGWGEVREEAKRPHLLSGSPCHSATTLQRRDVCCRFYNLACCPEEAGLGTDLPLMG